MKAQNFLIVAILPLATLHNANAAHRLVVSTSSSTGTYCWDDLDWSGQPIVVTCNCNSDVCGNVDSYPSCESETDNVSTCYLGSRNGVRYFCDISAESACSLCGLNNGTVANYGAWQSTGSNRVRRTVTTYTENSDYMACNPTTTTNYEYGCAAGYYQSGGNGASMTCTQCPSSGGATGTNAAGTTDITTCCIPANTSFSDTSGSGKYTSECCYTK